MSLINVSFPTTMESQTTPEMIWDALQSLPGESLGEVLRFIHNNYFALNFYENVSN